MNCHSLDLSDESASARMKTCFISSPGGTDFDPIERALASEGYSLQWRSAKDGTSLESLSLRDIIGQADLFLGVLAGASGTSDDNVLLETGMAIALRRPILLVLEGKATLPPSARGIQYIRVSPETGLEEALRLRLHMIPRLAYSRDTSDWPAESGKPRVAHLAEEESGWPEHPHSRESRFEAEVDRALFESGLKAIRGLNVPGNRGPDFVVWFNELDRNLLNPVAIEVKSGRNARLMIPQAARQLRSVLAERGAPLGLIVFQDSSPLEDESLPVAPVRDLPIFTLSSSRFSKLVRNRTLGVWLSEQQDAWAHGRLY